MKLTERIASVSGSRRGIGEAIALALAREEAHLVLASRTLLEPQAMAAEATAMGQRPLGMKADVPQRREGRCVTCLLLPFVCGRAAPLHRLFEQ
jgi:NAD(P)-dependent dehydrogenase (short-subunit alcohol dehydrogenase family)